MEILSEIRNGVAIVTLNRPAALNALSLEMVLALRGELAAHAGDPRVRAVFLRGAGGKAFCAGGDIRALYYSFKELGPGSRPGSAPAAVHREFFAAEYPLDRSLYSYPKPYAVLMDGITMGGGMGLAQGSRLRIVGDRTRMAMPEVGIGFFPDVGGSYFLSRLPGQLGMYLGLTGLPIRAADALYCRLADVYLPPAAVAALTEDFADIEWGEDPAADLRQFLHARAVSITEPATSITEVAPLRAMRSAIDEHFSLPTVPAILESLEQETRHEYSDWSKQTAKIMRTRSPTMLAVTLRQLRRGKDLTLADCFRMEFGMVQHCFAQGDFLEGVRALIVDKDNAPRWTPNRIEDVSGAMVDAFFRDRWTPATHPLANL